MALADFPALASVSGSVYLVVAAPKPIFPIVLTRAAASAFAAVSSECAHNGCVVNTFSDSEELIICNCHGSRYTAQGVVVEGPARFNLTPYPVRLVGAGVVEVEVPNIGFALAGALVNTAAGWRLRLSFPTVSGLAYEFKLRTTLTTPASTVPFSLSEGGATTLTRLTGDGTTATVYVGAASASGYLSIARF